MLALARAFGQRLIIRDERGREIIIEVVRKNEHGKIVLGIEASKDFRIEREEIAPNPH